MTAGLALFIIDALMLLAAWPLTVRFAVNDAAAPHAWLQAAIFAILDLLFLYALGLYRRDSIADTGKALGRIPLVAAIAVAAASFVTAAADGAFRLRCSLRRQSALPHLRDAVPARLPHSCGVIRCCVRICSSSARASAPGI